MEINTIIKERRKALGLTMKQVSDKVGVCESTYSRWENGQTSNMTRTKLKALADALSLDVMIFIDAQAEQETLEEKQDELFEKRKLLFDLSSKATAEDLDKFITILNTIIGD